MHLSYGPSNLKVVFDLNTWAHRGSCEGLGAADVQFSLLQLLRKWFLNVMPANKRDLLVRN